MRSRVWLAAALFLAACRAETGSPPPESAPEGERPRFSFERREAEAPSEYQIFSRNREELAPGVARMTVGAFVAAGRGEDGARMAMERIVEEVRRADSTLAAVKVLVYFPPVPSGIPGERQRLVPMGYLEWVPVGGGWEALTASSLHALHRNNIVFLADVP
jgi:hypothetical protein